MARMLLQALSICACVGRSFTCFAQTPATKPPPPRIRKPLPKVEMASWNEQAEQSFGISQDDFASIGFSKLTQEEYVKLLLWIYGHNAKAEQKGMDEGKAAVTSTQTTYSCGPKTTDEASVSKVKLIIEDERNTPSALMSGIRQRLRSIPDVQIVYDEKDADLSVDIIGFETTLTGSNVTAGYSAAVITTLPCTGKFQTNEWNFQILDHALVQTGGKNVNPMVEDIVTTLDSKSIESIRRGHASMKKFLQEQKKPQ
jgi:hypothetical protein